MTEQEIWRKIAGTLYEVSSLGRVRNPSGRILRPVPDKAGYLSVFPPLGTGPVKFKRVRVHRLVCAAFHGAPPTPDHHACHIDHCRSNNRADNLKWGTRAENDLDRQNSGHIPKGEQVRLSKITNGTAQQIASKFKALAGTSGKPPYGTIASLSREFGVSYSIVKLVVKGRTWRHATGL